MATQFASIPVDVRPARVNYAGVCRYCLERHCDSARCVALHAAVVWEVCPECDGSTVLGEVELCRSCIDGVIEGDSARSADAVAAAKVVAMCTPPKRNRSRVVSSGASAPFVTTADGRRVYAGV